MSALLNRRITQAQELLRGSEPARARAVCEAVLRQAPRNPDALYLLGLAHLAEGEPRAALPALRQVRAVEPRHGAALEHLGLACLMLGQFEEAEGALAQAATLPGAPASVFMRLGLALIELGRPGEALSPLHRALALDPQDADCHLNLGRALADSGDVTAARATLETVLRLAPDRADALFNLGVLHLRVEELDAARQRFEQALARAPHYADARVSLGLVLQKQGLLVEARAEFLAALAIAPDLLEGRASLAGVLFALGRYGEGIAELRTVLSRDENDAPGWAALADALFQVGSLDDAATAATRARTLDAGLSLPYSVLALIRIVRGDADGALASLREGYDRTRASGLLGMLAHQLRRTCNWPEWRTAWDEVARRLPHEADLGSPFWMMLEATTAEEQLAYTRRWVQARYGATPPGAARARAARRDRPRRLRVGYLSSEFHEHAIAYLLAGVLEAHDRERFEIFAYSYGPEDASPMRARLRDGCDHFIDVAREPDDAVARRIEDDTIDLLVDLKGYTMGARTGILARRPCPVQVNWLGYPGTMGAPFIDYLIADGYIIPEGAEHSYAERVVRLGRCWQSNDRMRPVGEALSREAYGLPEEGFVFCCFAQSVKITPEIFARWMNLLRAVPGSVLWLAEDNAAAASNLRQAAMAHGIAADRLVISGRVPYSQHLARYGAADLALDTFPYTSHSTASDGLWCGCPLVALVGETFAARVSGSILTHAGLPDLITTRLEDYEALALALATDPQRLEEVRSRVAAARGSSLFDAASFARDLEGVYGRLLAR